MGLREKRNKKHLADMQGAFYMLRNEDKLYNPPDETGTTKRRSV